MYRIGQVAAQLDLSPPALRRLSERFADWLSEEAGSPEQQESGRHAPRMYTEADVEVLKRVRQLQDEGLDDDEIEEQFDEEQHHTASALAIVDQGSDELLVPPNAAAALGQALRQLSDTQQALLTSQQAHRDLLSVIINDAMGLKDENERLRKRLRMMEEEMNRLKESDWNHRLSLEERMNKMERKVDDNHDEQKRSWWDRFMGK